MTIQKLTWAEVAGARFGITVLLLQEELRGLLWQETKEGTTSFFLHTENAGASVNLAATRTRLTCTRRLMVTSVQTAALSRT